MHTRYSDVLTTCSSDTFCQKTSDFQIETKYLAQLAHEHLWSVLILLKVALAFAKGNLAPV